jgi:hypothetical protein
MNIYMCVCVCVCVCKENLLTEMGWTFRHRFQTDSETHPASYSMITCARFLEGKTVGAWNWPRISI